MPQIKKIQTTKTFEYKLSNVLREVMTRLTDEALEVIISMGRGVTWSQFEEKWRKVKGQRSYWQRDYDVINIESKSDE